MNNNGAAGNEGSSSNPNRPSGESPRRGSGGANTPRGRGRVSSPRPTPEPALFTPPRSAATQPQHWPPSGGASGSGGSTFAGGHGGYALPVGDSGSSSGGAVRVGGSPLGRKRGREGSAGVGIVAAADVGGEGGRNYSCSVCNKAFSSPRAVFGHMRKHPNRGWTGAHPPPAFRAEEEFADLPVAEAVDNAEAAAAEEEEEDEANYRVPDLNNPPPPDSN